MVNRIQGPPPKTKWTKNIETQKTLSPYKTWNNFPLERSHGRAKLNPGHLDQKAMILPLSQAARSHYVLFKD